MWVNVDLPVSSLNLPVTWLMFCFVHVMLLLIMFINFPGDREPWLWQWFVSKVDSTRLGCSSGSYTFVWSPSDLPGMLWGLLLLCSLLLALFFFFLLLLICVNNHISVSIFIICLSLALILLLLMKKGAKVNFTTMYCFILQSETGDKTQLRKAVEQLETAGFYKEAASLTVMQSSVPKALQSISSVLKTYKKWLWICMDSHKTIPFLHVLGITAPSLLLCHRIIVIKLKLCFILMYCVLFMLCFFLQLEIRN